MAKKRKQPIRLSDIEKKDWDAILDEVDKKEIPVELLDKVIVNFIDDTNIVINIQKLIDNGADPEEIEELLNKKMDDMEDLIKDVDFHITRDKVVSTIAPFTKSILKKLK